MEMNMEMIKTILERLNLRSEGLRNGQCVEDNRSRLYTGFVELKSNNTPRNCINKCLKMHKGSTIATPGYAFAGVQNGYQCFCGQSHISKEVFRPAEECNFKCPGDSKHSCGGSWRMNVYATNI